MLLIGLNKKGESSVLKIVTEFGSSQHKLLLIELPKSLMDGIEIAEDGSVNTMSLIEAFKKYYEQQSTEMSAIDRINIYDAIFNPDRAVQQRGKLL